MKDIARMTGVSIKTVSRAINNHPDINGETRKKILQVAEDLAYVPNSAAMHLRQKNTNTIGFVIPDMINTFFGEAGLVIDEFFSDRGYLTISACTHAAQENEIDILRRLIANRVSGIILATVGNTGSHIKQLLYKHEIPLVVIDNEVSGLKTNIVLHDDMFNAAKMMEHLYQEGYSRIGFVSGPLNETSGKRRYDAYRNAAKEKGCYEETLVRYSDWTMKGGLRATKSLLQEHDGRIDAVFFANSLMAIGGYRLICDSGFRIPDDIAVAGYDDLAILDYLTTPLTTINKLDTEIGRLAAARLYEMIETGDRTPKEYLVQGRVICRESTRKHLHRNMHRNVSMKNTLL